MHGVPSVPEPPLPQSDLGHRRAQRGGGVLGWIRTPTCSFCLSILMLPYSIVLCVSTVVSWLWGLDKVCRTFTLTSYIYIHTNKSFQMYYWFLGIWGINLTKFCKIGPKFLKIFVFFRSWVLSFRGHPSSDDWSRLRNKYKTCTVRLFSANQTKSIWRSFEYERKHDVFVDWYIKMVLGRVGLWAKVQVVICLC